MKNKHNLTFISLFIYLIIILLLPKSWSNLFNLIPIRTTLTYLLFIIFLYDKYHNKIVLNDFNFKWIGIIYGIFIILTIPSFITTKSIITTAYTITKFIAYILLFYICLKTKFNKEEYRKLITLIIILSTFKFLWGLIEYIFEINLFTVGAYKYPGAKGRISAYFFNTIYYGIYINLIFAYILYLFHNTNDKIKKIFLGIILLLAFITMMLTFTRSSFLVFFGILFLVIIFLNKRIVNKCTVSLIAICLFAAFIIPGSNIFMLKAVNDVTKIVVKQNFFEKLLPEPIDNSEKDAEMGDYSLAHRKLFAKTALDIGKDNAFTGIGFGSYFNYLESTEFINKYPQYEKVKTHPHSSVVLMFSEVGVLALLAFTFFISSLIVTVCHAIKNNYHKKDIGIITLIVSIGFYLVNIIAENAFYDTQIFSLYLLIIGISINYINDSSLVY